MESVNISHIRNCYGCGVCNIVCPKNIIKIELNREGFYEPNLFNEEACTKCGLCLSVCAYNDNTLLDTNTGNIKVYAAWSKDPLVRRKCTSGGMSFELGSFLIKKGYKACGVQYNPDLNRAEHFMASTVIGFIPSIGSKYIQSYTPTGFSQFNRNDKFFVTGTPCQIDSLRRYIRKLSIEKNFVLMDFFCHGVPSLNMWRKYTEMVVKQIGKISYASWRNKITGWHDSTIIGIHSEAGDKKPDLQNNYNMLMSQKENYMYISFCREGDLFYEFFLGDNCLGRACYDKCKYKYDKSAADIRVGDLWGITYNHYDEGVSTLLIFTDKGKDIISQMEGCTLIQEDIKVVTKIQQKTSPRKNKVRKYLLKAFNSKLSIKSIYSLYQIYFLPQKVFNKLSGLIKFS